MVRFPQIGCWKAPVTNRFVPVGPVTITFPNGIPLVVAHVFTLKPLAALPPASVEEPLPNRIVWPVVTFIGPLNVPLSNSVLEAVVLACGSTKVNVPPVRFMLDAVDGFKSTIAVAEATLFAAFPPALPSTFISPPL